MRLLRWGMRTPPLLRPDLVAAMALVVLVLWAAIGWILHQAHAQAIDVAAGMRQNLARSLAEYQDASVRAIDLSLQMLRDEWMRDPGRFDSVVARQEIYLRKEKVIQVAVADAGGRLLYSRLPVQPLGSFADRGYFKAQRASGADTLHVSEPVLGRVTKQWAIQVTRPLRGRDGAFAGVIIVAVPPPALETVYRDIVLGPDGVISLVRSDGQILARTADLGHASEVSIAGAPGVGAEEPTAGDYRMRARLDGVERFYSYRKLQSYPLTIFVGQSDATVLAPYYRQRDILLVGGVGATMMLAALLALALSRARDRRRYLEEQERVALDLHDSSIQSIYAVGLHLENSRRLIDTDPQRAARLVGEAEANLNLVIQDLRALIAGEVAPLGEKAFLDGLGRSIPAPGDGNPAFVLELEAAALRSLGEVRAIHVQRIAGEAISNVVRHARAKSARLSLVLRNGNICIEVSDDGVGMPEALNGNRGLGLHHIQARARKLGGQMNVASTPGGTRVTVEFPSK